MWNDYLEKITVNKPIKLLEDELLEPHSGFMTYHIRANVLELGFSMRLV